MIETRRIASCVCGQLTATTLGAPIGVAVCHCHDCQRRTGSVFAAQARFPVKAVAIAGVSHTFIRVGDGGSKSTFHFCPTCGATVFYTNEEREESIIVTVGSFADPTFPAPTFSVYEERMHAWVEMPAGIEHMD
ncbi:MULTISPECIES: GFA family protein [Paraburkholderia]|uniref:GFA family protein n=1 Tax=Paraburkholderia TaxID=1822464 RepID=UPI002AB055AF|nr:MULTISPECIES: GFA family protein [Paraburkholderia]